MHFKSVAKMLLRYVAKSVYIAFGFWFMRRMVFFEWSYIAASVLFKFEKYLVYRHVLMTQY